MDIDYFKYVNDTLGHATGDQLIIKVAKRLEQIKTEHMTVYRLSGDEFVLVMNHIDSREEAEEFARKILDSFADDTLDLNYVLQLSLSIGIVIYPEHGKDLEELLRYADLAMYRVKENGKKNYMVYHPEMGQTFSERVVIEKHLRNALKNNEFEVHYQPQLDLQTMKMRGFEALLRWKSNALGNVPPLRFIPIAEETHEIIPIGTWVLEKSCEFLHDLNEAGYDDLTVSVNISMFQLVKEDFCDIVERIIHKYNIKPYHLELEITETILMESFETIIPRLKQLNQIQVKIALDDFGKGYSSLNYLKQLPINTLKIDKIFIDSVLDQNQDVLTGQIIVIGKRMGLEVIAEGVETRKQMEYLKESGCDIMQGYLYSKPVCGSDMIRMLEENGVPFDKD